MYFEKLVTLDCYARLCPTPVQLPKNLLYSIQFKNSILLQLQVQILYYFPSLWEWQPPPPPPRREKKGIFMNIYQWRRQALSKITHTFTLAITSPLICFFKGRCRRCRRRRGPSAHFQTKLLSDRLFHHITPPSRPPKLLCLLKMRRKTASVSKSQSSAKKTPKKQLGVVLVC